MKLIRKNFRVWRGVEGNAGRYKRQSANVDSRPYWRYLAVLDPSTRPACRALNERVFHSSDPVWQTIYPPNGVNCRCIVQALTEAQAQASGAIITGATSTSVRQRVGTDKETGRPILRDCTRVNWTDAEGNKHTATPDPGWSCNLGETAFCYD